MYGTIQEKTLEEIKQKLDSMTSDFNKINYLEAALSREFTFDIKRFLYTKLAELYEAKRMYEKAAKAITNRTINEVTFRERIASFMRAGELYIKAGKIEDGLHTYLKALTEANTTERQEIKMKIKAVLFEGAKEAEKSGRKANVIRYYEKLLELPLSPVEKQEIKAKLLAIYKALGKFSEAKALEGRTLG